jgi:hypothetical protein
LRPKKLVEVGGLLPIEFYEGCILELFTGLGKSTFRDNPYCHLRTILKLEKLVQFVLLRTFQ